MPRLFARSLCAVLTTAGLAVHGAAPAATSVSTLAQGFNGSGDVAVAPDGNIYVGNYGDLLSNSNGTNVVRITPEGEVSIFAAGFSGASGNSFDAAGNLYQSNISGGSVVRIDPEGNTSVYAGGLGGGVIGNAFDSNGNLFVNSCGNNQIYRIDPQGGVSVFVSGGPLSCPNGLTADDQDNLYAVNFNNGSVIKVTPAGQMSVLAVTPNSGFRPSGGNGHVIFANGVLYVASNAASRIFEITLDGQMSVVAGSGVRGHADGDPATASFSFPNGIDVSPDGRLLYVNESESTAGSVLNGATFPLTPNRLRVIELFEPPPPDDTFQINAGLAGSWFNPETPGQGLLLDPTPSNSTFFGAWFTHALGVEAKVGAPEHRWVTLQGEFAGDTAALDIFLTTGGAFAAADPVTTAAVGSATLTFSDCIHAELVYAFDDGPSGTIPLARLTADTLCGVLVDENE